MKNPFRALAGKRPKLKVLLPWLLVVVLLIAVGGLYWQYRMAQNKLDVNNPQYYSTQTKRLSKLIILPTSEKPTILTVKDADKLKAQKFYAGAHDGDLTFVYTKASKAILYRPDKNIIVNVAPVNVNAQ